MSKKHFIALADAIRNYNEHAFDAPNIASPRKFEHTQLYALADFCRTQNPNFNRERWLDYIAGKCGPNGGAVKAKQTETR
jgi:hypothetical protein